MKISSLIICCLFFLFQCKVEREPEYMIFSASYFPVTHVENTNKAILIMEKDSIEYFRNLFQDNDLEGICPCGFDYRLEFFANSGSSIDSHLYYSGNTYMENNDKIQKEIETLSMRLNNYPTHYIYNLKINDDPYSAMKKLKRDDFLVFILDRETKDKPLSIQVLYSADFESLKCRLKKYSFVEKIERATESLEVE